MQSEWKSEFAKQPASPSQEPNGVQNSDFNDLPWGKVYVWHADQRSELSVGLPNWEPQDNQTCSPSSQEIGQSDANLIDDWNLQKTVPGHIQIDIVPLLRLHSKDRLAGKYVSVHNETHLRLPYQIALHSIPLGDVRGDHQGDFFYDPHRGGGRVEKSLGHNEQRWQAYVEASRFGEVNSYYHIDRVADYVDGLLKELGFPSLPPVVVKVNAHNGIANHGDCVDGEIHKKSGKCYPLQGGHYRLATRKSLTVPEYHPVAPTGEIHLGPGWRLAHAGALSDRIGAPYRCNASHNAGTLYHEYGHHLTGHTADFRVNRLLDPYNQCNFKVDLDEGYADYLAATMLDSPHIWCFHHRHDSRQIHRRSLLSTVSMDQHCDAKGADAHRNGTILAATFWDLRQKMLANAEQFTPADVIRHLDLMLVYSLILIGRLHDHPTSPTVTKTRRLRKAFGTVLQALLESDQRLFNGSYRQQIETSFAERKIVSGQNKAQFFGVLCDSESRPSGNNREIDFLFQQTCSSDPMGWLPQSEELMTADQLEQRLTERQLGPYALVAVGDVMVGDRAKKRTEQFGIDYIFRETRPLFQRSAIVMANQEGPIAAHAKRLPRNHSYKVPPQLTQVLKRGGINLVSLANNHLLDCGREGVRETLDSLNHWGIQVVGGGVNQEQAHRPAIFHVGSLRIGILGYYWNRRTAATRNQSGSAVDSPENLERDISSLKKLVDRIVVTVHWGVPYERVPTAATCERARLMISLGADLVVGHHPHIIQRCELFQGKAIFYSLGNFAFGTGNHRAESMAIAVQFMATQTVIDLYPVYVKNRDPRVNYQPKIMSGVAGERALGFLEPCSYQGGQLEIRDGWGRLIYD